MTFNQIRQEQVVFLRNSDILTVSQRGVTTSQDTGTFSSTQVYTLATNPTLVKNIRGITDEDSTDETYETFDSGDLSVTKVELNIKQAQTFTIGATGTNEDFILKDIELKVSKDGTPTDDLLIEIKNVDSRGFPEGSVLSSLSVDESAISDINVAFETFNMPSVVLKKGKTYAIVLSSDTNTVNEYSVLIDSTAVYSGGHYWPGTTNNQWNPLLTTWAMAFKINGQKTLIANQQYWVDYDTGIITFENQQTGAFIILYDQGSTDSIFSDIPRDDLSIDSYPRLAVDLLVGTSDAFGIGGSSFITSYILSIVAYSDDIDDINTYLQAVKTAYINSANNFFYISFIRPNAMGPLIESPDRSGEIIQRSHDFEILFEVQTAA